ncbi:DUF4158 domain-containing protein [Streptomyces sp. NPDC059695]|uniref:DUF4158 domain-containing protein n=1 Tax=Streptomyces sp. NPDC059695 TaxID=3346910 RepID=UPI0036871A2F
MPGNPSTTAHRLDARPSGPLLDFSEGRVRGGRAHNRLRFAVQLTTVRFLGRFMPDPRQVPHEVAEYLAEQLGIEDASVLAESGAPITAEPLADVVPLDRCWISPACERARSGHARPG